MTDTITVIIVEIIIVEIIKRYLWGGDDGDAISSEGYNYIIKFLDDRINEILSSMFSVYNK